MYPRVFSFKGILLTSLLSYDLVRIVSGHHSVHELYLETRWFTQTETKKWSPVCGIFSAYSMSDGECFDPVSSFLVSVLIRRRVA